MERETGFEPATPSLEGWRSTTELFPHRGSRGPERPGHPPDSAVVSFTGPVRPRVRSTMVARGGFEPPKAFASRFTVCPLWPTWVPRHSDRGLQWNSLRRQAAGAGCETCPGSPGLLTMELA